MKNKKNIQKERNLRDVYRRFARKLEEIWFMERVVKAIEKKINDVP